MSATPGTLGPGSLQGSAQRRRREAIVRSVLMGAAILSVLISAGIIASLIVEAVSFLTQIDLADLFAPGWFPRRGMFSIPTLLAGTLIVTGIAMLLAAPIGLLSAIYLSEYASPKVRSTVKPILEILAGIPSVVLGFFALIWIGPNIVQAFFGAPTPFSLAAAGIGVGILTIPLVASVSEDALRAVPNSLREASYGMGARKITTSVRVVVPAAVSGLVAALVLAVSRAIGETMVVAIAAGATGGSIFSTNIFKPGQTMTAAMAAQAAGTDAVRGAALTFQSLFFVGLLLFLITLGLNLVADRYVRRVRQAY